MFILFKLVSHFDQTKHHHVGIQIRILAVALHFTQNKFLGTFRVEAKSTCEYIRIPLRNQTHFKDLVRIKTENEWRRLHDQFLVR
ncbi:hypothetical protein D3C72_1492070 [compost metagenome]